MNRPLKYFFILVFLCGTAGPVCAQIYSGKITYERRTNLQKKFKDDDWADWIPKNEKHKVDVFELYFNDSLTFFKEKETDVREYYSWFTEKNTVYQDLRRGQRLTLKTIWSEIVPVSDSLFIRKWKITDSKRTICGYSCRKAVWTAPDSTRIYAWYCDEIAISTGPESFVGLPGAILGLATEDGGVVYFATRIERTPPDPSQMLPKKSKDKIYTSAELRARLEKEFGKEKWGKAMIRNAFGYW